MNHEENYVERGFVDSFNGDYLVFIDFEDKRDFKHGLVFFGGLQGIEGIVEELDENTKLKASEVR